MFDFNPIIINMDYSKSLRSSLLTNNLFKTKPVIIHCFFHFIQAILKKMKSYKIFKTKLSKHNFELLKNIEIACFIPPSYIKSYITFIKSRFISEKEKKLFKYLENNWFKKIIIF